MHLLLLGELAGSLLALSSLRALVLQVWAGVRQLEEGPSRVKRGIDGWPEGRCAVLCKQTLKARPLLHAPLLLCKAGDICLETPHNITYWRLSL